MRNKHIENQIKKHPHISEASQHSPNTEIAILKLVVDSYLHGSQTCELHDGKTLGVSIHQGDVDHIHFFIDESHKVTVEVKNGMSRITIFKNKQLYDVNYVLPFTKCFGLSEKIVRESYKK